MSSKTTLPKSKNPTVYSSNQQGSNETRSTGAVQQKNPSSYIDNEEQKNKKNNENKNVTKITIKKDVGFNNELFIRGQGANLSWDKGVKLKNVSANEWVFETNIPFNTCEFKILINDQQYENGKNHFVECGSCFEYTPQF